MILSPLQTSRAFFAALLLSLPLVVAAPAHAQPAAEAARYFQQGKAAYKDGRYPDAYDAYQRAWDIQKGYDIAGNLGNVEVQLGRYRDAVGHLQFVLDNLPPSISGEKRTRVLARTNELLRTAQSHVAVVTVAVTPDGAALSLDGNSVGVTPLAQPLVLDPGSHTLVATLDGHAILEHAINARKGTRETVRLTMVLGGGSTPPGTGDTVGGGPNTAVVIAGTSIAVVGIGLGAVFLGLSAGKDAEAEDITNDLSPGDCVGPGLLKNQAQCDALDSVVDSSNTFNGAGIGLMVTGGAVGVATLVYALWPREGGEAGAAGAAFALPPVLVTPLYAPGFAGVGVSGRF